MELERSEQAVIYLIVGVGALVWIGGLCCVLAMLFPGLALLVDWSLRAFGSFGVAVFEGAMVWCIEALAYRMFPRYRDVIDGLHMRLVARTFLPLAFVLGFTEVLLSRW